jgi:hypothetical protein
MATAGTKAQVTGQPDRGADRGGHRQAQPVQRLHLAESLPQAVGLNCAFAHHASPFLLCRGSRSGGDRSGGDRHDKTLDIERLDVNLLDVDAW